jgi:hypothetical protein
MAVINTPEGIARFQLAQWRAAIKLEALGMRHSSGRSVRKHAAIQLGMKPNAKADAVLAVLNEMLG